jgi:hemolysin activation/secretion protein/AraC-like DNA-binding protein
MIRLLAGEPYWLYRGEARELRLGDGILAAGEAAGCMRASQLGEARFVAYTASEAALPALVTSVERLAMEQAARETPVRHYAVGTSEAARIGEILEATNMSTTARRCRVVEMLAESLTQGAADVTVTEAGPCERFDDWCRRSPEAALIGLSLESLAKDLQCSPRHLSRLFQAKFGASFRRRQTELRLDRAQRLLLQSDAKVIQVALDSGYHHLGLFNTLFKRRFGMTPTEWRRRKGRVTFARRVSATAAAVLAASIMRPTAGMAAEAPVAAATNAPAASKDANPTLNIKRYEVDGNTLLTPEAIEAATAEFTGPAIDFNTVRQALQALQLAYRSRGWATVSISVPPQTPTNQVLRVNVTEGRLAEITIQGNRWFGTNNIRRALPGVRTNIFLNSRVFGADLDNANLNPDRQIYPQIQPGPEPGTTALVLKVKDQIPLHGRFELNNQSTPSTPDLRANVSGQYNNLWDREHSLGLQYMLSPQQFKDDPHWNMLDRPLIASYSGYYRIPLADTHSVEEDILAQPQRFGFDEVTKKFRLPPSTGKPELNLYASRLTTDTGQQASPLTETTAHAPGVTAPVALFQGKVGEDISTTESVGFRISKPAVLSDRFRGTFSFGADLKNFQKASYNTNIAVTVYTYTDPVSGSTKQNTLVIPLPQPNREVRVSYLPWNFRWDGGLEDRLGSTMLGTGAALNFAGGPFSPRSNFQHVTGSQNSSGSFTTLQMSAAREFKLPDEWVLAFKADGQWTSEPVISNEQFGVGGTAGVRGYQEGERYGDRGWRAAVEQRTPLVDIGMVDGTMPMRFRGVFFTDYGRSYLAGAPSTGSPTLETLWGAGAGLSGTVGATVDFRFTIAWALRETPNTPVGSYRLYFGIGAQF